MDDENNQKQLERLIHRELRALPEVKAPETLVHRVMLAVHAKERLVWWQRPWLAWPFGFQFCSLVVLLVSAGLVSYFVGAAWDGVSAASAWQRVASSFSWLQPFWEIGVALANSTLLVLRAANQNLIFVGTGVVVLAYLACVGLGTVCVRMAFNRG